MFAKEIVDISDSINHVRDSTIKNVKQKILLSSHVPGVLEVHLGKVIIEHTMVPNRVQGPQFRSRKKVNSFTFLNVDISTNEALFEIVSHSCHIFV